jgi:hypothetical protein
MSFGQELKEFVSSYKDVSETIDKGRESRARTRYNNAMAAATERGEGRGAKADTSGFGYLRDQIDRVKDMFPDFDPPTTHGKHHDDEDDVDETTGGTPGEDKVAVNEGNEGSPGVANMKLPPGTANVPLRVASAGPALTPAQLMQQQQALPLAGVVASQQGLYQPPGAVNDTQSGYG